MFYFSLDEDLQALLLFFGFLVLGMVACVAKVLEPCCKEEEKLTVYLFTDEWNTELLPVLEDYATKHQNDLSLRWLKPTFKHVDTSKNGLKSFASKMRVTTMPTILIATVKGPYQPKEVDRYEGENASELEAFLDSAFGRLFGGQLASSVVDAAFEYRRRNY